MHGAKEWPAASRPAAQMSAAHLQRQVNQHKLYSVSCASAVLAPSPPLSRRGRHVGTHLLAKGTAKVLSSVGQPNLCRTGRERVGHWACVCRPAQRATPPSAKLVPKHSLHSAPAKQAPVTPRCPYMLRPNASSSLLPQPLHQAAPAAHRHTGSSSTQAKTRAQAAIQGTCSAHHRRPSAQRSLGRKWRSPPH